MYLLKTYYEKALNLFDSRFDYSKIPLDKIMITDIYFDDNNVYLIGDRNVINLLTRKIDFENRPKSENFTRIFSFFMLVVYPGQCLIHNGYGRIHTDVVFRYDDIDELVEIINTLFNADASVEHGVKIVVPDKQIDALEFRKMLTTAVVKNML